MTTTSCCNHCAEPAKQSPESFPEVTLWKDRKFRFLSLAVLIVLPFEILSLRSIHLSPWIELPLFLSLIAYFGWPVFRSALKSLLKLNVGNINLLMTIAVIGALYLGENEEAVIITVLFALGEALEAYGVQRSQSALQHLVSSSPKTAQLKGKDEKTPIEQIQIGDIITVFPGDQIPLDGEIIKGSSLIDEATITGEPLPRNKSEGDAVFAATFNGDSYLEIRVTKTANDTTLAKIIHLTYESSEKKASSQKFIEKFARYYTPAIIVLAILVVVVPVLAYHQPFQPWLLRALSLLVIACPCALVISTPVAVFSAIGNATKKGILVKGGQFMEAMGKVKAIAFDKTRTLTKGEPIVSDIVAFNGYSKEEVLACAAGMEAFSKHPVAKSITDKAQELKLDMHAFENFQSVMGKGVKGDCLVCTDKHHCLGSRTFVGEEHAMAQEVLQKVDEFEAQGKTTIVMSTEGQIKGVIGVTDALRPESAETIATLTKADIHSVILTGDNLASAQYVAKTLGIDDVRAGLLPEAKVEAIRQLGKQYGDVAMIGDGVNDAAALATATVGIAMGAVGSDIAMENADIALMTSNLNLLPFLVRLGQKCQQKIRFNVTAAIIIKLLFIGLALSGHSNLALAIFADVGVTVLVILNSLRLYSFA